MPTLKSRRFLRAPENDEPISAAPPTNATTMKPTNAGVLPNASAACCTDSTNTSLTCDKHRNACQSTQRHADRQRCFANFTVLCNGKEFAVSLERKQQTRPYVARSNTARATLSL